MECASSPRVGSLKSMPFDKSCVPMYLQHVLGSAFSYEAKKQSDFNNLKC